MNNTEIYYKYKYLKYKKKYLKLRNITGGDKIINKYIKMPIIANTPYKFEKKFYIGQKKRLFPSYYERIKNFFKLQNNTHPKWSGSYYEQFFVPSKNSIFKYIKIIGHGSYGVVMQYKDDTDNYIAVKYGKKDDIKKEKDIILKMINDKNQCSNLVVQYILNPDCIIMENANGTIKDLRVIIEKNKNTNIIIDVIYAITIAIKCLYDNNLYYTDIKMANILYRNTNEGIQIILGDLGSITDNKNNKNNYTYTYRPSVSTYDITSIILWGIGILILDLLQINHYTIHEKYIYDNNITFRDKHVNDEVSVIIDTIKFLYPTDKYIQPIIDIINITLCPKNTKNLDDILNIINTFNLS